MRWSSNAKGPVTPRNNITVSGSERSHRALGRPSVSEKAIFTNTPDAGNEDESRETKPIEAGWRAKNEDMSRKAMSDSKARFGHGDHQPSQKGYGYVTGKQGKGDRGKMAGNEVNVPSRSGIKRHAKCRVVVSFHALLRGNPRSRRR